MSCCYKCENRTVDCHVSCEKYAAEMEENKKKLEELNPNKKKKKKK